MDTEKFWRTPYQAPSFSGSLITALIVTFACFTFVRGTGYAFDSSTLTESPQALGHLHSALWGWGFMIGSLYLILTLVASFKFFVWTAHVFSAALYLGLLMDLTKIVAEDGGHGYLRLLVPLTGLIWHAIFVRYVRPFGKAERGRV